MPKNSFLMVHLRRPMHPVLLLVRLKITIYQKKKTSSPFNDNNNYNNKKPDNMNNNNCWWWRGPGKKQCPWTIYKKFPAI
jgi:hypothetical protein